MPLGSKYDMAVGTSKQPWVPTEDKYKAKPPTENDKAVKAVKSYDQIRNTVMDGGGPALQNVSQVVSNLRKTPPKSFKAKANK